jgi:hypothetical protein
MTPDATIDYERLHQEALRGLVRAVLTGVSETGLPGDHHFYISYDVRSPGVALSKRLREKYPTEMTIVLQHRFWDLVVTEDRFEVKLTFDGIPERLVVPFSAIKVFLDPSVRFVLHFEDQASLAEREANEGDGEDGRAQATRKRIARTRPRPERPAPPPQLAIGPGNGADRRPPVAVSHAGRPKAPPPALVPPQMPTALAGPPSGATSNPAKTTPGQPTSPQPTPAQPTPAQSTPAQSTPADVPAAPPDDPRAAPPQNTGAQVVSLDQFRKK